MTTIPLNSNAAEKLKVFTWDGYVLPEEVIEVNKILKQQSYDIEVEVITPWAEGPAQMYDIIRSGKCDISFLTLNYIKMQSERTALLLQPINTSSPRLTNYKHLRPELTNISMGERNNKPLYIPFGGGAYGLWANMNKLKESDLPKSYIDLLLPKWKGRYSLSKAQIQPNIAIALMTLNKSAFYLNDLVVGGKRESVMEFSDPNGSLQKRVNEFYANAGDFWGSAPNYNLDIEASYGIEIVSQNEKGGKWKLISFKEPNTVWMDTINFHKDLQGKKLEAAEIFANFFISKQVQTRVVNKLGMVSVSKLVDSNPLIDQNPNFFNKDLFWPPYDKSTDNIMTSLSDRALKKIGK
ncbi:MAG: extracellular solute-binding protein [Oligoflexia bacterium]|nr:extracellular solute-binding protein [Oligoflexia bacterium]